MSETKIITGLVRFSYAKVFTPEAVEEGADKKYSVSILVPKSDKATIKKIEKAIEAAKEAGKAKLGKIKGTLKTPLRDGDEERPEDEAYENMMFFSASSKIKPQIVDKSLEPITDEDEFYSGCWGRASINFYAFNVGTNKGIAAGLNNLQKLKDDDNLTGRTSAFDDFDEMDEDDYEDVI